MKALHYWLKVVPANNSKEDTILLIRHNFLEYYEACIQKATQRRFYIATIVATVIE